MTKANQAFKLDHATQIRFVTDMAKLKAVAQAIKQLAGKFNLPIELEAQYKSLPDLIEKAKTGQAELHRDFIPELYKAMEGSAVGYMESKIDVLLLFHENLVEDGIQNDDEGMLIYNTFELTLRPFYKKDGSLSDFCKSQDLAEKVRIFNAAWLARESARESFDLLLKERKRRKAEANRRRQRHETLVADGTIAGEQALAYMGEMLGDLPRI